MRSLCVLLAACASVGAVLPDASAGVYTVTVTADSADGSCDTHCSLREAVIAANADPDPDTVVVPGGLYVLTLYGPGEDQCATGDLDIRSELLLQGDGSGSTIIDGNAWDRVLHVDPGGAGLDVGVDGITLTGGQAASGRGGGISSRGRLTLTGVTVTGCSSGSHGGGIDSSGNLNLDGVTVHGNDSGDRGGGVYHVTGSLDAAASVVYGNRAASFGGGLHLNGVASLVNVTISDNIASQGGGLFADEGASLLNCTVADNASPCGDAVRAYSGSVVELRNTLVRGRCLGTILTFGGNVESPGDTCSLDPAVDRLAEEEPLIGIVAGNGGPTPSRRLFVGSPAIDAGVASSCPATDQRGVARDPAACDAGAYERRRDDPPSLYTVFEVTDTADGDDGSCDSHCSLREAVRAANVLADHDVILLPAGRYELAVYGRAEDEAETGDLDILANLTLQGSSVPGRDDGEVIVDGSQLDRLLHVDPYGAGLWVNVRDIEITGGLALGASGGGIASRAHLKLSGVTARDNHADVNGGGIHSSGPDARLEIERCNVVDNVADDRGGGLYARGTGSLRVADTSIIGNEAATWGGGAYVECDGGATLVNTTVYGNTAAYGGGVLRSYDPLRIVNCTFAANVGPGGGAIRSYATGAVELANTLVAGDCMGTIQTQGGNVESPGDTCSLDPVVDRYLVGDPLLGPPGDHGGPTETCPLLDGSQAIDFGSTGVCPRADQRLLPRADGACDTGAYEYGAELLLVFMDGFDLAGTSPWSSVVGEY